MRLHLVKSNKRFARAGGMHHRRTTSLFQQPLDRFVCSLIVGKQFGSPRLFRTSNRIFLAFASFRK